MDRSQGFEKLWEDMFVLAEEYYKQNNNLLIQHSYVVNDTRLGAWISSQRTKYSTNTLDEDRKTKLENIGMIWDVKEYQWMQMYNVAKWYYEKFGDLRIPLRYVTPDGKKLGGWISQQRKNYSRLGTKKANPLFTENKVILLNELEMVWDATDTVQSTSFPEQCIVYYASQADLLFSSRTEYLGVEIDVFFPDFNIGIEYDGERWHKSVQRDIDKNIICRDAGLKLIRIREPKCPEIPHSINYFLKDYSYTELSNVLYEVFVKYFGCNLDIDVEKDQGKIIEQYVVYSKQKWKELIAILSDYKDKHGHIQIGRDDIVGGYRVGSWIHELRKRNKNGTLCISKAQRKQLNDLGMIWNQYEATWNDMYCSAKQYYDEHGNLQVPSTYITEKDSNLLSWLNEQRKKYVKGTLEQDYVEQLNALEFEWTPVQTRWTHMYSLAQQYYRDNGDLLVPARYRVAGENLGNWITVQRKNIYTLQKKQVI